LLELSNIPRGAVELVSRNIFDSFCNNSLTARLQEGGLGLFTRFGDAKQNGPSYVERNPLHSIWCQMLGVVNNINRHCGRTRKVFEKTANFMHIYSPQIGKAFDIAYSANDTLFGLNPSESLSTPLLEEIERINMIFFGLSKHFREHLVSDPYIDRLFVSFKDCSLILLQRYLNFFTHPSQMQAQLYPVDNVERQLNQTFVTAETKSTETTSTAKPSKLMLKTLKSILTITHYMLTSLIILTDASVVLTQLDHKWPFGNTIIHPDMRVATLGRATFGTLTEFMNTGAAMFSQWQNSKDYPASELLDVVQDCSLLLTTQIALWIASPNVTDDERMEIAQDSMNDIVESISKVESTLKKMNGAGHNFESKIKLIQTLQSFLGNRYYKK
jgi:hypothetical protein